TVSCYCVFFYDLTPRLPLTSPLFPYTTLFRSLFLHQIDEAHHAGDQDDGCNGCKRCDGGRVPAESGLQSEQQRGDHRDAHCSAEDRKSTRLNSSHVSTSYAVFCLKKKKLR